MLRTIQNMKILKKIVKNLIAYKWNEIFFKIGIRLFSTLEPQDLLQKSEKPNGGLWREIR